MGLEASCASYGRSLAKRGGLEHAAGGSPLRPYGAAHAAVEGGRTKNKRKRKETTVSPRAAGPVLASPAVSVARCRGQTCCVVLAVTARARLLVFFFFTFLAPPLEGVTISGVCYIVNKEQMEWEVEGGGGAKNVSLHYLDTTSPLRRPRVSKLGLSLASAVPTILVRWAQS